MTSGIFKPIDHLDHLPISPLRRSDEKADPDGLNALFGWGTDREVLAEKVENRNLDDALEDIVVDSDRRHLQPQEVKKGGNRSQRPSHSVEEEVSFDIDEDGYLIDKLGKYFELMTQEILLLVMTAKL